MQHWGLVVSFSFLTYLGDGIETIDTGEEEENADNGPRDGEISLGMGHDPYCPN